MAKHIVHQFLVGPGPSGEFAVGIAWAEHGWKPLIDVYETPEAFYLTVEVPGVAEDSLDVHFIPDAAPILVIEGRRSAPHFPGPARCLQVEIENGPFRREMRLPRDANGDAITAARRDGLLVITVPRHKNSPSQSVKVDVS